MYKLVALIGFAFLVNTTSIFAVTFQDFVSNMQIASSKNVSEKVEKIIDENKESQYVGYEEYHKFITDSEAINRSKAVKKTVDDIALGNSSCTITNQDIIRIMVGVKDSYIGGRRNNLYGVINKDDQEITNKKVNDSCRLIISCIENKRSPLNIGFCRSKVSEKLINNYNNIDSYESSLANMQIKTAFFDGKKENGAIELSEKLKTMLSLLTDQQEQVTMIYKPSAAGSVVALNEGRQIAINDPYVQASTVSLTTASNSVQKQVSQFINQSQENQAAQVCLPGENNQPSLQEVIDQLKAQQGQISSDWATVSTTDQVNDFIKKVQEIGSDKLISIRNTEGMLAALAYDPETDTYAMPNLTAVQEFNGATNITANPNQPTTTTEAKTVTFDNLDGPLKNSKQLDQCLGSCNQKTQCSSKSGPSKANCEYLNLLCKSACLCNLQGTSLEDNAEYTDSGRYKLTSMNAGIQGRVCLIPTNNDSKTVDACKSNGKYNTGGRAYNRGCMGKNLDNWLKLQLEKSSGAQAYTAPAKGTFASKLFGGFFKNAHQGISLSTQTKPSIAVEPVGYAQATSESRREETKEGGPRIENTQIYSNYESMIDGAGLAGMMKRFSESLTKLDGTINGLNESFTNQCK